MSSTGICKLHSRPSLAASCRDARQHNCRRARCPTLPVLRKRFACASVSVGHASLLKMSFSKTWPGTPSAGSHLQKASARGLHSTGHGLTSCASPIGWAQNSKQLTTLKGPRCCVSCCWAACNQKRTRMPVQSNDIQAALSRSTFVFNAGMTTMHCIKLVGSWHPFLILTLLALSGAGGMAFSSIVCAVPLGSDILLFQPCRWKEYSWVQAMGREAVCLTSCQVTLILRKHQSCLNLAYCETTQPRRARTCPTSKRLRPSGYHGCLKAWSMVV